MGHPSQDFPGAHRTIEPALRLFVRGLARPSISYLAALSIPHPGIDKPEHGKVIAGHQLISAMLAEMATNVDASRLLIYRAASMIEAGVPAEMEAAMDRLLDGLRAARS